MDKRYLRWGILLSLLALLVSQFVTRPDWQAYLSLDYWKSMMRYAKVMRIVEAEFVHADEVSFQALTDTALREAVRTLDPYSDYMTPRDYEAFSMEANQEYVGVGVELSRFSGRVIISQVFEQGSASSAGVTPGDFVVGVDGEDTRGETLDEVVQRIRGESGTAVVLRIERPITRETLSFDLERQAIALDSVVDIEMKEGGIGYMRVRQFIDDTDVEMINAIRALKQEGMRGLILDLRGNPGGRLDTAARMAEVFLQEGQTILTVQSRRGVDDVLKAWDSAGVFRDPLLVLIDGNSASASEILAGALRDHSRAVLVGEKSFGKGSVQSIYAFSGGDGLKLTSARYLLPGGEAINGTGVYPDITVSMTDEQRILLLLQKHHLHQMTADAFERTFGFAPVKDRQLEVAGEILEGILAAQQFATAK